jgi:hypothetical protein
MKSNFIDLDIRPLVVGCEDVDCINVAVEDREPLLETNNDTDAAIKLCMYFCLCFVNC